MIATIPTAEVRGPHSNLPPRPESITEVTRTIALHRHLIPTNARQVAVDLLALGASRDRRYDPLGRLLQAIEITQAQRHDPVIEERDYMLLCPTESYFVKHVVASGALGRPATQRDVHCLYRLANALLVANDHLRLDNWAELLLAEGHSRDSVNG